MRRPMSLQEGHPLTFDYPVERAVQLKVNGAGRFTGHIVAAVRKRSFLIETVKPAPPQGKIKEPDAAGSGPSPPEYK
jgi:hypothetical protein